MAGILLIHQMLQVSGDIKPLVFGHLVDLLFDLGD